VFAVSQCTLWSLNSNPDFAPQVEICTAPDEAVFWVAESELLLPPQPHVESRTDTANRGRSLDTDGSLFELSLRVRSRRSYSLWPKSALMPPGSGHVLRPKQRIEAQVPDIGQGVSADRRQDRKSPATDDDFLASACSHVRAI
jgi:hypothetical protein